MKKKIKNLTASVRDRLSNRAKGTKRPFDELLQYFAMERFLYRLSRSKYKDKVVLKGALMFVVWRAPRSRATRDIDLLGRMGSAIEQLKAMVKEVCRVEVEPDGITFNPATVTGKRIKEDADYEGVRIRFTAYLDRARAPMQIDFGFGDTVFPKPAVISYPTILGMPEPRLKGYPRETDEFAQSPEKVAQWRAFLRRGRLDRAPKDLETVIQTLRGFLLPIVKSITEDSPTPRRWQPPGPWRL